MPTIERFEDVQAWKKGRELAAAVYRLTASERIAKDFELRDQLRRAALSVVSNVAEGFERRGDREFRRFLSIAKGSAGEIRAQLYVAFDAGLVAESDFHRVLTLATETSRVIGGLMRYLDNRDGPSGP